MSLKNPPIDQPCPCDLAQPYARCCGRYHAGDLPPTAVALMRSRYSAYVLHDEAYLVHSWHPRTRPEQIQFDPDQRWLGLKIKSTLGGEEADTSGEVMFAARYKIGGRGFRLEEHSSFERLTVRSAVASRWVYVGVFTSVT